MDADLEELARQLDAANGRVVSNARAVAINGRPPQFGVLEVVGRTRDIGDRGWVQEVPAGYDWSVTVDGMVGMCGTVVELRLGVALDRMDVTGRARVSEISGTRGGPVRTTLAGDGPLCVNGCPVWQAADL